MSINSQVKVGQQYRHNGHFSGSRYGWEGEVLKISDDKDSRPIKFYYPKQDTFQSYSFKWFENNMILLPVCPLAPPSGVYGAKITSVDVDMNRIEFQLLGTQTNRWPNCQSKLEKASQIHKVKLLELGSEIIEITEGLAKLLDRPDRHYNYTVYTAIKQNNTYYKIQQIDITG